MQFLYLHAIVSPGKPRLLLLLKKKEEKGGGKGQGQGQGHNDDDAHGRSEKIAGIQLFHTDDDGLGCLLSRIIQWGRFNFGP